MMVLAYLWLVLNALFKIAFVSHHPSKDGILNFLIVLLLKKVIMEKAHRSNQEKFAALETHVE